MSRRKWSRDRKPSMGSVIQRSPKTALLAKVVGLHPLMAEGLVSRLVSWVYEARNGPCFDMRDELPAVLGVPEWTADGLAGVLLASGWVIQQRARDGRAYFELAEWPALFPMEAAREKTRQRVKAHRLRKRVVPIASELGALPMLAD